MKRNCLVFLFVSCVFSQAIIFSQDSVPPPRIFIAGESGTEKLRVNRVEVEALIHGVVAETRMTLTFYNPHNRVLAGDLYFPLPEGATISGYALDINGRLVEGVVVEKDKARQVFEKEVRKGVDPGLVEWVKGNHFKTRVYPIPAHGTRTVLVRFICELTEISGKAFYQLPLYFPEKVAECVIRVDVLDEKEKPLAARGGLLEFQPWRHGFRSETKVADVMLAEDLRLELPRPLQTRVMVETAADGHTYFVVRDPCGPGPFEIKDNPPPQKIVLLWDASASRAKGDRKNELAVIRRFFSRWQDESIRVDLVFLRHAIEIPLTFFIEHGDCTLLLAAIENVAYDGGTQIGALAKLIKAAKPDLYLLFSDGLSNFGKSDPGTFSAPLYVASADAGADHFLLRHLAQKSGGAYFNLQNMTADDAGAAIGHTLWQFLSAKTVEGGITETFPQEPRTVQTRLVLAGKLLAARAELLLNYGSAGRPSRQEKVVIDGSEAEKGELLRTFWAQKKIEELLILQKQNQEELVAIGKRFGLVTPGTSLIVLETLEQYLEHRIVPPKTLAVMRGRYLEIIEKQGLQQKKETLNKLERIVNLWQKRLQWWKKDFKYPAGFRYQDRQKSKINRVVMPETLNDDGVAGGVEGGFEGGVVGGVLGGVEGGAEMSRSAAPAQARMAVPAKEKAAAGKGTEPAIVLKEWDPKTPYLAALKTAGPKGWFTTYLKERNTWGNSPAFFLDCADFFRRHKRQGQALQILSNIAELELENAALLRILAQRLRQLGYLDLAIALFWEVKKMRPEEPQSWRDLALALEDKKEYRKACELLYHVVLNQWDRFDEIEIIALLELNHIIPKARAAGAALAKIDPRLLQKLDLDVRIVMTWDADLTDMDLWVSEPSREKAYYGHNLTTIGGLVSRDFTQGYGPEEYVLKKAMPGMYKIESNFFGSQAQSLIGAVTMQVDIFTNYGRADEKKKSLTFRLTQNKETFTIGEIEF